jgi:hypothetical protein
MLRCASSLSCLTWRSYFGRYAFIGSLSFYNITSTWYIWHMINSEQFDDFIYFMFNRIVDNLMDFIIIRVLSQYANVWIYFLQKLAGNMLKSIHFALRLIARQIVKSRANYLMDHTWRDMNVSEIIYFRLCVCILWEKIVIWEQNQRWTLLSCVSTYC